MVANQRTYVKCNWSYQLLTIGKVYEVSSMDMNYVYLRDFGNVRFDKRKFEFVRAKLVEVN